MGIKLAGPLMLLGTLYAAARTVGVGPIPKKGVRWRPPGSATVPDALRVAGGLVQVAESTGRPRLARMALQAIEAAEQQLGPGACVQLRHRINKIRV